MNVRVLTLLLICIENKETHLQWVSRMLFMRTEWQVPCFVPIWLCDKWYFHFHFHCLGWIWTNNQCRSAWVKHWSWPENNSYVAFFKWKQAVFHLWLMNSPFQLASVIHRMKIFQETWRLLFLFYHFPLNVLCDRCVLFSTLDCWAYVMFFIFSFMKHLLQRNIFNSIIEFSLTHLVKITIIASLFLIEKNQIIFQILINVVPVLLWCIEKKMKLVWRWERGNRQY